MRLSTRQLVDVASLLRDAAQREIIPRFRNLEAGSVRTKTGPLDLVTEADERAEVMITDGLRRLFPGCVEIGRASCRERV